MRAWWVLLTEALSAGLVDGLCPARFGCDGGGGAGGRGSEESSSQAGHQKVVVTGAKSRGVGQPKALQWEFHIVSAKGMSGSYGWIN